jgi:DNA repair photolyase
MDLQQSLFGAPESIAHSVLGEQKDVRYYEDTPRSILNSPAATGMSFWSINPYVGCIFSCQYCYARFAHRYRSQRLNESAAGGIFGNDVAEMPHWLAFERRILVKREAGSLLRRELRRPVRYSALQRETLVIGTATDPYQPAERRFRVTRGVLEAIAEQRGMDVTIITKSPLVTRDIDLLRVIADRSELSVHVSLITVDRELARRVEPRAPTPDARLRAIKRLRENGIVVGVNCMPVLPGITDAPEQIEALVSGIASAGASYINACALRLRSTARQQYLPFIEVEFPALATKYRSTYSRGHQAGPRYREGLRQQFSRVCKRHGVSFGTYQVEEEVTLLDATQRMERVQVSLDL